MGKIVATFTDKQTDGQTTHEIYILLYGNQHRVNQCLCFGPFRRHSSRFNRCLKKINIMKANLTKLILVAETTALTSIYASVLYLGSKLILTTIAWA
jgi:hypothetical protein